MTNPKRTKNIESFDTARNILAKMTRDMAEYKRLLEPPSLSSFLQADRVLDQFRRDHTRMRQVLPPPPPPLTVSIPALNDVFGAGDYLRDVLTQTKLPLSNMDMAHNSWHQRIGNLTDFSTHLGAAVKSSLGETSLHLAATETVLPRIDFGFLRSNLDLPVSTFSVLEQSLSDTTASYRALFQSIPDLSAMIKLPSFVLPGATVTLLLAAYALRVLDLLIQPDNEESEGEDLTSILEYLENLDFTALLEQVNPSLAPVYLGARNDLEGDAPDRARHVLYSLRELSNFLIREIAPLEQNMEWLSNHGEEGDWDNNCRPSRRGKIRFLTRKINSRTLVDFVDTCTRLSSKLHKLYNRLHKLDPGLSDDQLNAIHYGTVAQLSFLIQVWQTTTQHQGPH